MKRPLWVVSRTIKRWNTRETPIINKPSIVINWNYIHGFAHRFRRNAKENSPTRTFCTLGASHASSSARVESKRRSEAESCISHLHAKIIFPMKCSTISICDNYCQTSNYLEKRNLCDKNEYCKSYDFIFHFFRMGRFIFGLEKLNWICKLEYRKSIHWK